MRTQAIGNGVLRARIPAPFAAGMRALKLHGADPAMLRSLRDEEWRELLPLMDRAHLTLPFAQRHVSGIPGWVREQLDNNLADTARHWEPVRAAYCEAAAALDANGLEYLILKGFTQAPDFVPRPELRWQGDIDFYVPREHISAAVEALQKIGYASCYTEEKLSALRSRAYSYGSERGSGTEILRLRRSPGPRSTFLLVERFGLLDCNSGNRGVLGAAKIP